MAVDKSWDHGPATQVNRSESGETVAQVRGPSDGRDATVPDGQGLRQWRRWLEGVNPTVDKQHVFHSLDSLPGLPGLRWLQSRGPPAALWTRRGKPPHPLP